MFENADVQPMLPVKDLKAAERFYEEVLKLEKVGSTDGAVSVYRSGKTKLCVYRSEFAGTNKGTAAVWEVNDVEGAVKELKAKGVKFEHYDMPASRSRGISTPPVNSRWPGSRIPAATSSRCEWRAVRGRRETRMSDA